MCIARSVALSACLLAAAAAGCSRSGPATGGSSSIRLIDLYEPAMAEGSIPASPAAPPKIIWRFEDKASHGWRANTAVRALVVRDGLLSGETTGDFPIIAGEREEGPDDQDVVHSVEVRMRVSAGANLSLSFSSEKDLDFAEVEAGAKAFQWDSTTPLVADQTMRTYTIRPARTEVVADGRRILLRPTDAAGASFAIESVRVTTRKEQLASIPSGVSWQGLSEVYRETLVARSPETLRFPLTLPERPMLDLAIGTVEDGPITFTVRVSTPSATATPPGHALLTRTVTRAHRWESVPIDLAPWAGQVVDLTLTVSADANGALGFWGAPAVRVRQAASSLPTDPPRGVIVIWADTLRRDHLSFDGYQRDTSPVLKRMADEGTLFTNCYVNATWTKVSTPSLMTSLYPTTHGVADFADRIPASAVTLAEVYRDAGYATLGLSSVVFVGRFTNLHQGFEIFHEDTSLPKGTESKTAREHIDTLLPWLTAHRDLPFFVLLHVTDPHDPFRPYAPYDSMWGDSKAGEQHSKDQEKARASIKDPLLKMFGMPTRVELEEAGLDADAYVQRDIDWYDGSIRAMDTEIGRLIERLRDLGLGESTLVVFTSDHGEEFLEHGRTFHGQSVYGELMNVPLLLWKPGSIPAGRVVSSTVQTIDLMPTLLATSGLAGPDAMQGRSLLPLLTGSIADGEEPPVFAVRAKTTMPGGAPPPRGSESYAVVDGGWKLVRHTIRMPDDPGPEFELFDAANDPLDAHDVAKANPEIVTRLASRLEEIRSRTVAARLKPDSADAGSLSPEELERLRSLGYIQ